MQEGIMVHVEREEDIWSGDMVDGNITLYREGSW